MNLEGKGCFIWKIPRCENGDPEAIANLAKAAQPTRCISQLRALFRGT